MRTQRINETSLWIVNVLSYDDVKDLDDNFTGEKEAVYDTPTKIRLSMYPNDGNILKDLVGDLGNFDYLAVSCKYNLTKDTLLFKTEPSSNFDTTFDYKIVRILDSLNGNRYLLESRL